MGAKETYYFSHDCNARNDPKILMLRSVYGYEGYGWYWALIEIMREQKDYKLKISYNSIYKGLAVQFQSTEEKVKEYIADLIHFELLEANDEYIWSNSLIERMEIKDAKKAQKIEQAKKASQARWGKKKKDKPEPKKIIEKISETKNIEKINQFYEENNFGLMGGNVAQEIISYLDDGMKDEMIIEALRVAVNNNKLSWSYAKACLQDWYTKKIYDIKELKSYIEKRKDDQLKKKKINKVKNYVPQHANFKQREYDDEYFESIYTEV